MIAYFTKTRVRMFRQYMPMSLSILAYGDAAWMDTHGLAEAPLEVVWHFRGKRRDEREAMGAVGDWR